MAEFANPHSWLLSAENLHEQATALYATRDQSSLLTRRGPDKIVLQETRGVDKPVFLLGGFALENAIKAFLVYEHPAWISNGRLAKHLKSHSLTKLQDQSSLVPFKKRYLWVLKAFESGLDSWFRYPCALTIEETEEEQQLYAMIWDGYLRVMHAYGKRLVHLLDKGWNGPHGFVGNRWEIRGETLGYKRPLKKRS
ncbi:hypothetical protein [Bradyrhizobium sp. Cp5.3]|uniref:hypothetical protein n=1 Tax=Bradyrhizobium sp. Cp5.3 TaxID=443598 RepID=UPI0012EBC2FE|nr:hypothetical protein [Bradyrhizobium sp. Cp5.3]